MSTDRKSVQLDPEVYERIADHKRDDETFSEAIDRLTATRSLLDLAGLLDEEEADRARAAIEAADEADAAEVEALLRREW